MHRVVGFERTVHAEHAEPLLLGRRIGAESHQRRRDRKPRRAHKLAQERRSVGAGIDDAAASVENRLLRRRHHLDGVPNTLQVPLELGLIGLVRDVFLERVGAGGELHVLRNVDDHRAGPAVRSDIEGLVQDARQILDATHKVIMLGAAAGDAGRVAFLEGVGADQVGRHLAGDADQWNGVHERIRQRCDGVGRARAGGDEQNPDLAGRARVTFRRMARALLVAHENVAKLVLMEDGVVNREHCAARIAEDHLDALVLQRLDDHLRAGHLLGHIGTLRLFSSTTNSRQQKRPSRGLRVSASERDADLMSARPPAPKVR